MYVYKHNTNHTTKPYIHMYITIGYTHAPVKYAPLSIYTYTPVSIYMHSSLYIMLGSDI